MATKYIDKEYGTDSSTAITDSAANRRKVQNLPDAAGLAYDKVDNQFKFNGADAIKVLADTSTAQTLTTKTLTAPTITAPVISGAGTITAQTISGNIETDTKVLAANATFQTNSVLATLTGFSWTLVAGATYKFEVNLPGTQTVNGGLSVAFKYTTATMTSIQVQTYQSTAVDNGTAISSQSTTTTDATKFVDNKTAAFTLTSLKGTFVVGTGGTMAVQACQNTSNSDTTTILLGSYATVQRVV